MLHGLGGPRNEGIRGEGEGCWGGPAARLAATWGRSGGGSGEEVGYDEVMVAARGGNDAAASDEGGDGGRGVPTIEARDEGLAVEGV